MSTPHGIGDLSPKQMQTFYTANSGAELANTSAHTVAARIKPDAHYVAQNGRKYPLYLAGSLEAFRASREGGV